jgi:phage/plasmid-like protein (TIGR03299 family)
VPHNLFKGKMAWVDEVPWHGLGTQVPADITAPEMIQAANLAWQVAVRPAPGARLLNRKPNTYDRYLIERDPVGREKGKVVLGFVRNRYVPLQNAEAFSFFEPFISNRWASFCSAGALGNGQRVWVQAQLSGDIVIGSRDVIKKFLLLSNSHNGSGAVKIFFTPVRVVCQNTLNFALREDSQGLIVKSVRHTRKIAERLEEGQGDALKQVIDNVFTEAETLFGRMAAQNLGAEDTNRFLELLFPLTDKQKKANQEPERWMRIRAALDDEKITPTETRNTLWGLYNAVVWDEDYRSSREANQGARLERIWFGSGHDLKIRALNFARLQLAA